MNEQPGRDERGTLSAPEDGTEHGPEGVGDALRAAVERTLAATADSAGETRQRAQELLDDVVRRGHLARERVARRGEEATKGLAEAISELRRVDAEGIEELAERLDGVERRLAALEAAASPQINPQVEAEDTRGLSDQQRDLGD